MPARTAAEKLARKQALEEKREARRLAKEKKDQEKALLQASQSKTGGASSNDSSKEPKGECLIFGLSDDTLANILCFLPSREVGALTLTCRHFSALLVEARINFLMSRLQRPNDTIPGAVGCISMCSNQIEAR